MADDTVPTADAEVTIRELESGPVDPAEAAVPDDAAPQDDGTDEAPAPVLNDEDYYLNFLGSDKFELPKETPEEIRAALKNLEKSLNKGWTEKNQSFAQQRQAFLDQQQVTQAELAAQRAMEDERIELKALQRQLAAYNEYTPAQWQAWSRQDPSAAQEAWMAYQTLQGQVTRQEQAIEAKQNEVMSNHARQAQQWLVHAEQQLSTEIPDWGPEKQRTLAKFVSENYLNTGLPLDNGAIQLMNLHPGLVRMANEAMAYRNSVKRATTPAKTPAPQPVAKAAGGTAPVAKDPERMSDAEWIAQRNESVRMANLRRMRR